MVDLAGMFKRARDKIKGASAKLCVPPADAKLHDYDVVLKLRVQATKKAVVKEAVRKLQGELPGWAPLLLQSIGVADRMKIADLQAEV